LRKESLARLRSISAHKVLIAGIGTGLDLPLLPPERSYVGLDLTRAMLSRARSRVGSLEIFLVEGDAQRMPFATASFDAAVLHLIIAVVPDASACLREVARVLRPGGRAVVLDKFLRRGERAWVRRALNPLASRIGTRTDVVFEQALEAAPRLAVRGDRGGWFRLIELERT
jgi:phosphatidylethanolamine/phosphatidyl-N-methylethanolamine N-methyltransferase